MYVGLSSQLGHTFFKGSKRSKELFLVFVEVFCIPHSASHTAKYVMNSSAMVLLTFPPLALDPLAIRRSSLEFPEHALY